MRLFKMACLLREHLNARQGFAWIVWDSLQDDTKMRSSNDRRILQSTRVCQRSQSPVPRYPSFKFKFRINLEYIYSRANRLRRSSNRSCPPIGSHQKVVGVCYSWLPRTDIFLNSKQKREYAPFTLKSRRFSNRRKFKQMVETELLDQILDHLFLTFFL